MRGSEQAFLREVSTTEAWALVERFATMPRWRPEDVNRAADHLAARLRDLGHDEGPAPPLPEPAVGREVLVKLKQGVLDLLRLVDD